MYSFMLVVLLVLSPLSLKHSYFVSRRVELTGQAKLKKKKKKFKLIHFKFSLSPKFIKQIPVTVENTSYNKCLHFFRKKRKSLLPHDH